MQLLLAYAYTQSSLLTTGSPSLPQHHYASHNQSYQQPQRQGQRNGVQLNAVGRLSTSRPNFFQPFGGANRIRRTTDINDMNGMDVDMNDRDINDINVDAGINANGNSNGNGRTPFTPRGPLNEMFRTFNPAASSSAMPASTTSDTRAQEPRLRNPRSLFGPGVTTPNGGNNNDDDNKRSARILATNRSAQSHVAQTKRELRIVLRKYEGDPDHPEVAKVIDKLHDLYINNMEANNLTAQSVENTMLSQLCGNFRTLTAPTFPGRIYDNEDSPAELAAASSTMFNGNGNSIDDQNDAGNSANANGAASFQSDFGSQLTKYTLGRISFNIFQPSDLVCTLVGIRNQVFPLRTPQLASANTKQFTYNIFCDMLISTPNGIPLQALICNHAVCHYEDDAATKRKRLRVQFTGGTLVPARSTVRNAAKLQEWRRSFLNTSSSSSSATKLSLWDTILQTVLGLTRPTLEYKNKWMAKNAVDALRIENSFHFDMKRSPVGWLDVLYMDDTMRITRGNRGTIVIVERMHQPQRYF